MSHDVALVFYSFATGFLIWPAWRLFHPWRCKCGRLHWSAHRMLDHVEMKHVHEVSTK